jgi:glycosyltransferase involved in cell wall biosynthesis
VKLLIASPCFGHYGGIEAFVIALAGAAGLWPEIELQVCFKLVQNAQLKDELKRATGALSSPVHYVRSGNLALTKLIHWADVVHGQNTSPDITFPAVAFRRKLVLTIHNWRRENLSVRNVLWRMGARLADRRWYNSQFVWKSWEPKKMLTGSDRIPTVSTLPTAWNPPETRKGFLFIGRWIENKGIEELVKAYAQANLNPEEWPLTLLGDGPLRKKVSGIISSLQVKGVSMPGFVDDSTKERLLASSKWLVAPARTREDLGLTPIEARSVGVPSIVTRDGGLPEAGGEAALIVEPGNIEELSQTLRKAASMSEKDYAERSDLGKKSLKTFLRPLSFYRDAYSMVYRE